MSVVTWSGSPRSGAFLADPAIDDWRKQMAAASPAEAQKAWTACDRGDLLAVWMEMCGVDWQTQVSVGLSVLEALLGAEGLVEWSNPDLRKVPFETSAPGAMDMLRDVIAGHNPDVAFGSIPDSKLSHYVGHCHHSIGDLHHAVGHLAHLVSHPGAFHLALMCDHLASASLLTSPLGRVPGLEWTQKRMAEAIRAETGCPLI